MSDKPSSEYIFDDVEIVDSNPKRAVAKSAEARIRMVTKSAIQGYIDSFLGEKGIRRKQLEFTAPFTVQYFTNVSAGRKNDPTIYDVQLARMWKSLRQQPLSIIISDGGMEWENPGLGGFDAGFRASDSTLVCRLPTLAKMTIEIMVASLDETTTGDLADALVNIFGPLTALNRSWWIRSFNPQDKWEVRLPLQGPSPTGLERRAVNEDPKDVIWTTGLTLEVEFEGIVQIGVDNSLNSIQINSAVINSAGTPNSLSGYADESNPDDSYADYDVPEEVILQKPYQLQVRRLPAFAVIYSDNPAVATIDSNLVIRPKRLGTFNVVLTSQRSGEVQQTPTSPKQGNRVIASHSVTVTF